MRSVGMHGSNDSAEAVEKAGLHATFQGQRANHYQAYSFSCTIDEPNKKKKVDEPTDRLMKSVLLSKLVRGEKSMESHQPVCVCVCLSVCVCES